MKPLRTFAYLATSARRSRLKIDLHSRCTISTHVPCGGVGRDPRRLTFPVCRNWSSPTTARLLIKPNYRSLEESQELG